MADEVAAGPPDLTWSSLGRSGEGGQGALLGKREVGVLRLGAIGGDHGTNPSPQTCTEVFFIVP